MAQSRITDYDGTYVSYWYQRHEDNEIVDVRKHAHDFMKKLIIHIPEKGFNMLRYYGLYAMPNKRTEKLIHLVKREMKKFSNIQITGATVSKLLSTTIP